MTLTTIQATAVEPAASSNPPNSGLKPTDQSDTKGLSVNDALIASLLCAVEEVVASNSRSGGNQATESSLTNSDATRKGRLSAAVDDSPNSESTLPPNHSRRPRAFRQVVHEEIVFLPENSSQNQQGRLGKSFSSSDESTTGSCTGSDDPGKSGTAHGSNKNRIASSSRQSRRSSADGAKRGSSRSRSRTRKNAECPLTPPRINAPARTTTSSNAPPVTSHRSSSILQQESDVIGVLTKRSKRSIEGAGKKVLPVINAHQLENTLGRRREERQRSLKAKQKAKDVLRRHLEQRLSGDKTSLRVLQEAVHEGSQESHEMTTESDESQILPFSRKERSIYKQSARDTLSKSPCRRLNKAERPKRQCSTSKFKSQSNQQLDNLSNEAVLDDATKVGSNIHDDFREHVEEQARRRGRRPGEPRARRRESNLCMSSTDFTMPDDTPSGRQRSPNRRRPSFNKSSDNVLVTGRRSRRTSASCVSRSVSPTAIRFAESSGQRRAPSTPGTSRKTISVVGQTKDLTSPSASRAMLNLSLEDFDHHITKSDLILMEKTQSTDGLTFPVPRTPSASKSNNIKSLLSSLRGSLGIRAPTKEHVDTAIAAMGLSTSKRGANAEAKHIPNLKPNRRDSMTAVIKPAAAFELEMEEEFFPPPKARTANQVESTEDDEDSINLEEEEEEVEAQFDTCLEPKTPKRRPRKSARALNYNRSQSQLGQSSSSLFGRSTSSMLGRSTSQLNSQEIPSEPLQDRRARQDSAIKKQDGQTLQPFQKRLSMAKMTHAPDF